MQVDWPRVQFPSQPWGETELEGCQLSALHQPARLRYEWEYLQGGEDRKGSVSQTGRVRGFLSPTRLTVPLRHGFRH